MKKCVICIAAALLAALSACGEKTAEVTASAAPTACPTAAATAELAPKPTEPAEPSALPTPTVEPSSAPTASAVPTAEPTSEPTPAPTQAPTPAPTAEPTATPTATLAPPSDHPSDADVLAAYHTAEEAFSWFAGYSDQGLMLDLNDALNRPDVTLYRVTRPGLDSLDALRGYLKTLFSDEVVDALMPLASGEGQTGGYGFEDGSGGLYARPAARGRDVTKGTVTLSVSWPEGEAPAMCTVQAKVQLMQWDDQGGSPTVAGEETYEFPYQKVGDKWVFTEFRSIF